MEITNNHDIVPAHLAVKAMRDNGYKNAAYAIAELIDNAVQAGASNVELLCGDREEQANKRKSYRTRKIAVLDDGHGMSEEVLRLSLQFGNGTHLDADDQGGIGKFGMGLPSSSMSQCKRVDVWSWQNGIENALHTHLDLDDILNKEMQSVPQPQLSSIPDMWKKISKSFGNSGTLVVWSELDRVMWKTSRAIIRNSENLIGRIYRRFLQDGRVHIRMHSFDVDNPNDNKGIERYAKPNDPIYLMGDTSCPYEDEPMFEKWGKDYVVPVEHRGETHEVKVTFTVVKKEARAMPQAGAKKHGKHAGKNTGISVVRADRELEMNESWAIQHDTRERWWGVEVEFPPALDNIFGVSNNKQSARNFHKLDIESLKEGDETVQELKDRLMEEDDPYGPLFDISEAIDNSLSVLRSHIKDQREGTRSPEKRHEESEAAELATEKTEDRKREGNKGASDKDEDMPDKEKEEQLRKEFEDEGLSEEKAQDEATRVVKSGLKYSFRRSALPTSAPIFSIKRKGGVIIVNLNTKHPGYDSLISALEHEEGEEEVDLSRRLKRSRKSLRLLLLAWARFEDEQEASKREMVQDVRHDWGRVARQFLREKD